MTISALIIAALRSSIFIYNMIVSLKKWQEGGRRTRGKRRRSNGRRRIRRRSTATGAMTCPVHRWAYDYSVPGQADDYTPQTVPADEVPVGRDHGVEH